MKLKGIPPIAVRSEEGHTLSDCEARTWRWVAVRRFSDAADLELHVVRQGAGAEDDSV